MRKEEMRKEEMLSKGRGGGEYGKILIKEILKRTRYFKL